MKTIIFNKEMTQETIADLIDEIETIADNEEFFTLDNGLKVFERTIYFSSGGGEVCSSSILINFINNNQRFVFKLIGYWGISSAGFDLFMKCKCERYLIDDAFSIIHLADRYSSARELRKSNSIDKFLLGEMEKKHESNLDWFKQIGITEEQIKEVVKGEDVAIGNEQLQQILQNTIDIFNTEAYEDDVKNLKETMSINYPELEIITRKNDCIPTIKEEKSKKRKKK